MFAPHCPTCQHRVLLGAGRIVRVAWDGTDRVAVVRCHCGELLAWNHQPADAAGLAASPIDLTTPAAGPQPVEVGVAAG